MTTYVTPLTYNGYVTQIATMAVVSTTTTAGVVVGVDAAFNAIIPQMLNYAELRIQRDLDLLQAQGQDSTRTFSAGNRLLTIPLSAFVTVQTLSVTVLGQTTPLLPVSQEFIQNVYTATGVFGTPKYFSPYGSLTEALSNTSQTFIVGPGPAGNYPVFITGLQRLQTLYAYATPTMAATGTTFISSWLPDLLIQASMIYISQYQRNFGPASNDPQMGPTYEAQYQTLLKGAMVEEARKNFEASAWTALAPAVVATPTRGA
jgi:hypothetical protein